MQRIVVQYDPQWRAGTVANASIDNTVNVSAYAHAAVQAERPAASSTPETGAQAAGATQPADAGLPTFTPSNTMGASGVLWAPLGTSPFGYTTQAGDALTFSTLVGTYQVLMQFAGTLTSGLGGEAGEGLCPSAIRNGVVASIVVDGALLETVDTYKTTPQATIFLDGNPHTVQIMHSGGYNALLQPVGPVQATVGSSVAALLQLGTVLHPTFVSATWRVSATGSSTYNLYKTPPGGSESLVASGLATGTTYSGASYVPGVTLFVGSPLVSGDGATFTTDVVMLALVSLGLSTGTGPAASTWTSPVWDFGDPLTQLVLAETIQDAPLSDVSASSGNVPIPDGSWTTVSAPRATVTTSGGTQWGTAGLLSTPPGRYGQVTLTLAAAAAAEPWVRDLAVYAWNPVTDPIGQRVVLHALQEFGPNLLAYVATLATWFCDLGADKDTLRAAMSIGGAVDGYLGGYMTDVGLSWVTGEPPSAARARARAVLSGAGGALSIVGIAQGLNLLVSGQSAPVAVTGIPGSWVAACGGCQISQVAGSAYQYQALVPSAPYAGLPGMAVGSSLTPGTANYLIATFLQTTLRPVSAQLSSITFTTGS